MARLNERGWLSSDPAPHHAPFCLHRAACRQHRRLPVVGHSGADTVGVGLCCLQFLSPSPIPACRLRGIFTFAAYKYTISSSRTAFTTASLNASVRVYNFTARLTTPPAAACFCLTVDTGLTRADFVMTPAASYRYSIPPCSHLIQFSSISSRLGMDGA